MSSADPMSQYWAAVSAQWIGRCCHQNNCKTNLNHDVIDQKSLTQNLKICFLFQTASLHKSLEGLNSSSAQPAAELWLVNI